MQNLVKILNQKKIYILIIILVIVAMIFLIKFNKKNYKTVDIGNNISNKTLNEVEEYILNINSYKATIDATIKSNKNANRYLCNQSHSKEEDIQEIIAPENIKGIKIKYSNETLTIQNTKLNLEKIYKNYPYIESNHLWLNSFIEDYKNSRKKSISKENEEIVMKVELENNKIRYKTLYLNKNTLKPTKLSIQDNSKNELIYILYNEIELK